MSLKDAVARRFLLIAPLSVYTAVCMQAEISYERGGHCHNEVDKLFSVSECFFHCIRVLYKDARLFPFINSISSFYLNIWMVLSFNLTIIFYLKFNDFAVVSSTLSADVFYSPYF